MGGLGPKREAVQAVRAAVEWAYTGQLEVAVACLPVCVALLPPGTLRDQCSQVAASNGGGAGTFQRRFPHVTLLERHAQLRSMYIPEWPY